MCSGMHTAHVHVEPLGVMGGMGAAGSVQRGVQARVVPRLVAERGCYLEVGQGEGTNLGAVQASWPLL